jgi:hypothetical protein
MKTSIISVVFSLTLWGGVTEAQAQSCVNRPNPTGSVYLNNDSASTAFTPNAQGLRVVNGGVYVVNGTFTVDSNLLIQNAAVFYFRKGAEVRVKPWATLTLDSVT